MDNAQLKKENSQLKRLPLFVAVVLEKLPGRELYLRQQGNNQEYVTSASEEQRLNDMASDQRVVLVMSDLEVKQEQQRVQMAEASF